VENNCSTKCCIDGCDNEVGFIESSFGVCYCQECEKLIADIKFKDIDISSCRTKKDLIEKSLEK